MKTIIVEKQNYKILKNYKNAFDQNQFLLKYTEYFDPYDYILGDLAYGKLRLKGFCKKENRLYNSINAIENVEEYIENDCAYECPYFLLEKVKSDS